MADRKMHEGSGRHAKAGPEQEQMRERAQETYAQAAFLHRKRVNRRKRAAAAARSAQASSGPTLDDVHVTTSPDAQEVSKQDHAAGAAGDATGDGAASTPAPLQSSPQAQAVLQILRSLVSIREQRSRAAATQARKLADDQERFRASHLPGDLGLGVRIALNKLLDWKGKVSDGTEDLDAFVGKVQEIAELAVTDPQGAAERVYELSREELMLAEENRRVTGERADLAAALEENFEAAIDQALLATRACATAFGNPYVVAYADAISILKDAAVEHARTKVWPVDTVVAGVVSALLARGIDKLPGLEGAAKSITEIVAEVFVDVMKLGAQHAAGKLSERDFLIGCGKSVFKRIAAKVAAHNVGPVGPIGGFSEKQVKEGLETWTEGAVESVVDGVIEGGDVKAPTKPARAH